MCINAQKNAPTGFISLPNAPTGFISLPSVALYINSGFCLWKKRKKEKKRQGNK